MPIVIDEILKPIAGASPGGVSLDYSPELIAIEAARGAVDRRVEEVVDDLRDQARDARRNGDGGANRFTQPGRMVGLANGLKEWSEVRRRAAETLTKRSKDLRVAYVLLEGLAATESFAGVHAGLTIIRRLVDDYWDSLFPVADADLPEPLARRRAELALLGQRFPSMVTSIPFNLGEQKVTLQHVQASQARGALLSGKLEDGWLSPEVVKQVIGAIDAVTRDAIEDTLAAAHAEVVALEASCNAKMGIESPPFKALVEVLKQCEVAISRPDRVRETAAVHPANQDTGEQAGGKPPADGDDVDSAITAAKEGRLEGLQAAQRHLAEARSGRERFLRQLKLAQICLGAGMHALAYPLLDELAAIVEKKEHDLAEWEGPDLMVQLWTALEHSGSAHHGKPEANRRAQEAREMLSALRASPQQGDAAEDPKGTS